MHNAGRLLAFLLNTIACINSNYQSFGVVILKTLRMQSVVIQLYYGGWMVPKPSDIVLVRIPILSIVELKVSLSILFLLGGSTWVVLGLSIPASRLVDGSSKLIEESDTLFLESSSAISWSYRRTLSLPRAGVLSMAS